MSTLKVDAIRHNSATSDAITTAADGTCTAKLTSVGGSQLSHRNLIINGAMTVAQRGQSATVGDNSYATVDRFKLDQNSLDEDVTQAQADVASGTTPYTLGFRKAFKITNGNQTSGAGSADRIIVEYKIEAQDIANSGWNYTSSSSYITFSYWVRSSVSQNFYNTFKNDDGTSQRYVTETGSLSANTWTKITKTIPGNSNLTFNNDNGEGLEITWELFRGTDQTGTRPLNAWAAADNATRTPDQTSTWYTTDDATFEITGVQLEVGDTATSFEHRSFHDELLRCQRYYYQVGGETNTGGPNEPYGIILPFAMVATSIRAKGVLTHPVPMRDAPTISSGGSGAAKIQMGDRTGSGDLAYQSFWTNSNSTKFTWIEFSPNSGTISHQNEPGIIYANNSTFHLKVDAEL